MHVVMYVMYVYMYIMVENLIMHTDIHTDQRSRHAYIPYMYAYSATQARAHPDPTVSMNWSAVY